MVRYEALMLTVPEITQDESRRLESEFDRVIKSAKATALSFEKWGKYRLPYPVKKNDYGIYFLARFELNSPAHPVLEELKTLFAVKLNDVIMRHMISVLDPKQGLEYERPLSVEEAPARSEGPAFFKEGKMDHNAMGTEMAGRGSETEDEDNE